MACAAGDCEPMHGPRTMRHHGALSIGDRNVMTKCFSRAMAGILLSGIVLHGCTVVQPPGPPPRPKPTATPGPEIAGIAQYSHVRWSQLPGWQGDDVKEAWPAFVRSCRALRFRAEWAPACSAAQTVNVQSSQAVRAYFEQHFEPYAVTKQTGPLREDVGLITGYYEPLLKGSRVASARFGAPLYSPPADLLVIDLTSLYPELKGKRLRGRLEGNRVVPYYDRAALETGASLRGREIVWVDDALDAFLLQVQGSGRVQLPNGDTIRLQYADQNGHPYQSIGRYLVDKRELTVEQATMPGIRQWLAANPTRLHEVLNANPSYVFFNEEKIEDPTEGPKGAQGVPLVGGRSIAVDPGSVPLGAPVFLDTTFPATDRPLQRLVIAQDTGGAIRGAVRADFFWGSGHEAGEQAGRMRQALRMWMLWPKGVPLPAG
jgi:membrane-bound lytic murein transglycosylase A